MQGLPPVRFFCCELTDNNLLCGKLPTQVIQDFKASGEDKADKLRDSGVDLVPRVLALVNARRAKGGLTPILTVSLVPVPNNDATVTQSRYLPVARAIAGKLAAEDGFPATVTVEQLLTRRGDVRVDHAGSRPHFRTPSEARALVRATVGVRGVRGARVVA